MNIHSIINILIADKSEYSETNVIFDAADDCRLYVTTMKAMNFQDDIPSIPVDKINNHLVIVFELTSVQHATEKCHYPKLFGQPPGQKLKFTFPLEHVTELNILGEPMSSVANDKFLCRCVVGEKTKMDNVSLQQMNNCEVFFRYRYLGSFPPDYVP